MRINKRCTKYYFNNLYLFYNIYYYKVLLYLYVYDCKFFSMYFFQSLIIKKLYLLAMSDSKNI